MEQQISSEALKELIYKIADDQLIYGHRNSEWTGIGPVIEEDIAFSSIAQDKIGQSWNLYQLLNKWGENHPDEIAFTRSAKDFKCSHLSEMPIGEYDFSLIRHFLFDHAELVRFEALTNSSNESLAQLAKKFKGEIKYHVFHADTWVKQLAQAKEEARLRLQTALNEAFPLAIGVFEPGDYEDELINHKVFVGENAIRDEWLKQITPILEAAQLQLPDVNKVEPVFGGRKGIHTEHLQPLLNEMTEVISLDPKAEW